MKQEEIIKGIQSGDSHSLSRAITLAESTLPEKHELALQILEHCDQNQDTLRIGITGTPGVGKSTFINSYCGDFLEKYPKEKVAILSVDPSSSISGGSILGDKTRMQDISILPQVFIRPTASGHTQGGLSRNTRLAILLCEAAGYNRILIESVGVGQIETELSQLCDLFILLLNPGGGDELQGIKRGIVEHADLILINKTDGENTSLAEQTAKDYRLAQHLMSKEDAPPILSCSALKGFNMREVLEAVEELKTKISMGPLIAKRQEQNQFWVLKNLHANLLAQLQTSREEITSELNKGILPERIAWELSKKLL